MRLKQFIWGLAITLTFSFAFVMNLQHNSNTVTSEIMIVNAQALAQDRILGLDGTRGGDRYVTPNCPLGQISCTSGGNDVCDIEKFCERPKPLE